jgi:DNA-binding PadR family transcriptional regulator
MPWMIKEADPGLGDSLYALLLPLERHGLVWSTAQDNRTPGRGMADEQYTVTSYGQSFLERVAN